MRPRLRACGTVAAFECVKGRCNAELIHRNKVRRLAKAIHKCRMVFNKAMESEDYSFLNATMGSTCIARRAGIQQPNKAHKNSRAQEAVKLDGSVAETVTNSADRMRLTATAPANPMISENQRRHHHFEYEPKNIEAGRANGHPYSDFPRALAD